jgi:ferredoxin-thioredoxin reductase catalytic chain
MSPKTIEQTEIFASMVAKKQGWIVNPDAGFRGILAEGLTTNWNRYTYYLCPCRDSEGSREQDAPLICPCKYSWDDIAEHGHCYCALYLSKGFAAEGRQPASIPDRRFAK